MCRSSMILLAIAAPAMASAASRTLAPVTAFGTGLEAVAVDNVARALVTGRGKIQATLQGVTLTVSSRFAGLASPAIQAQLFRGVAVGVPGKPVVDLAITRVKPGTVSGTLRCRC